MIVRRSRIATAEAGQTLPLMAITLTVMLIVGGLVLDGGIAFANRRDAQNAADLAALAGTKVIADHYTAGGRTGGEVHAAVSGTVVGNGCIAFGGTACAWAARYIRPTSGGGRQDLGSVVPNGSIPFGAQGVDVHVTRTPSTFFLPVIGVNVWDVGATSSAIAAQGVGAPASGILPIAVDPPNNDFQPGSLYELTAGMDAPGNFSWLSWNGSNDAGSLAESICNPNNPAMAFPVTLSGDPGKSNSTLVRDCVDQWISNGATVLIPTWSAVREEGNNVFYTISGLSAFVILSHSQPSIDSITARFVEYFALPSVQGNYGPPPCDATATSCDQQTYFLGLLN